MTQYSSPYNLPIIETGDKIASAEVGKNLRENINALSTATKVALTEVDGKALARSSELESVASTSERAAERVIIFEDDYGFPVAVVDDLNDAPHFRGSDTPTSTSIPEDSVEFTDVLGHVLFAVDDIRTDPHLRGSVSGGSFLETHFIILAGQSNSMGIGTPSPVGTNDPVGNLRTVPQRGSGTGVEVLAVEPLAHPYNNATAGTVGHGWTVARQYALEHPNVRVVILPMAASGTGFFLDSTGYTWAPSRVGEAGIINLYSETIAKCNTAIATYTGTKRVAMILWHQGEADAVGGTTQAAYEAELDALIAGFRTSITGATGTPFIVGQLGWEFRNVRMPGTYVQIDAAHVATPSRVTGTAFAPAPPQGHMLVDNTHFDGLGQKLMAASMLNVIQDAHYNL